MSLNQYLNMNDAEIDNILLGTNITEKWLNKELYL